MCMCVCAVAFIPWSRVRFHAAAHVCVHSFVRWQLRAGPHDGASRQFRRHGCRHGAPCAVHHGSRWACTPHPHMCPCLCPRVDQWVRGLPRTLFSRADDASQLSPLLPGEVVFCRFSRIRNRSTSRFGYLQLSNYRILFKAYAMRDRGRASVTAPPSRRSGTVAVQGDVVGTWAWPPPVT